MQLLAFFITLVLTFSLNYAEEHNYENQRSVGNGSPQSQNADYRTPTNEFGNRFNGNYDKIYTINTDGKPDIISAGNGNNRNNVFFINEGSSQNPGAINNGQPSSRNPPANNNGNNPYPQEAQPNPSNRFGNTENIRRTTTNINNFGNGVGNHNTFVNREERRPQGGSNGPTDVYTYTRIGHGSGNNNVMVVDGQPIPLGPGLTVTTSEHRGQGEQIYENQRSVGDGSSKPLNADHRPPTFDDQIRNSEGNKHTRFYNTEKEIISVGNSNNQHNVINIEEEPRGNPINTESRTSQNALYPDTRTSIRSYGNGNNNRNIAIINNLQSGNPNRSFTGSYMYNEPGTETRNPPPSNSFGRYVNSQQNSFDNRFNGDYDKIYTINTDGKPDIISAGNGNNRKNVFYINEGSSQNPGDIHNGQPSSRNPPVNNNRNYPYPQGAQPNMGNRFGNTENTRRVTTNINNIGNGVGNRNTFVMHDDIDRKEHRPQGGRNGPTDVYTYSRIGHGSGNNNVMVVNGQPIPLGPGLTVTTREHRGQGRQSFWKTTTPLNRKIKNRSRSFTRSYPSTVRDRRGRYSKYLRKILLPYYKHA